MPGQLNLFGGGAAADLPEGLAYAPDFVGAAEEQALVARMAELPFKAFEFEGYLGNRRTVSFGLHYEFNGSGLQKTEPMPDWLLPVRDRAAAWAGLPPQALEHVLLTEYGPGAGIGWHRDRPVFQDVVGLSLLAPARLRFRRKRGRSGSERHWWRSPAPPTCCAARRGRNGSTASPRWKSCATRSPSGA